MHTVLAGSEAFHMNARFWIGAAVAFLGLCLLGDKHAPAGFLLVGAGALIIFTGE